MAACVDLGSTTEEFVIPPMRILAFLRTIADFAAPRTVHELDRLSPFVMRVIGFLTAKAESQNNIGRGYSIRVFLRSATSADGLGNRRWEIIVVEATLLEVVDDPIRFRFPIGEKRGTLEMIGLIVD